jgi:preprotein translocase subunit SecG
MVLLPCLAVGIIMKLVAVLFALTCIALILIILVQKGKGGGLSSAFGGGMSGGVLGSKTGDFLTWVTIALVAMVLGLAVFLAKYYKPAPASAPGLESPPALQQSAPEEPVPPAGMEDTAGDANSAADADSSGT